MQLICGFVFAFCKKNIDVYLLYTYFEITQIVLNQKQRQPPKTDFLTMIGIIIQYLVKSSPEVIGIGYIFSCRDFGRDVTTLSLCRHSPG